MNKQSKGKFTDNISENKTQYMTIYGNLSPKTLKKKHFLTPSKPIRRMLGYVMF